MNQRNPLPPYSKRLNSSVDEIRILLGDSRETWARAARKATDTILMVPAQSYSLDCVYSKAVLMIVLDGTSRGEVYRAAVQLLVAGADQVAAINEAGNYRMFKPSAK